MKRKMEETERYRFIADSGIAKRIYPDGHEEIYDQEKIIRTLNVNKQYMIGGQKVNGPIDSPRQAYLIHYGFDKENVTQIIKIVVDKSSLEKGDPNALAIDDICRDAIKVKNVRIAKNVGYTLIAGAAGIAFATMIISAATKESEADKNKNKEFIDEANRHRYENGIEQLGASQGGLTFDDLTFEDNNFSRSL